MTLRFWNAPSGLWSHVEDGTKPCCICDAMETCLVESRGQSRDIISALGSVLGLITDALSLCLPGCVHSPDAECLSDRWTTVQKGSHSIPRTVQWIKHWHWRPLEQPYAGVFMWLCLFVFWWFGQHISVVYYFGHIYCLGSPCNVSACCQQLKYSLSDLSFID